MVYQCKCGEQFHNRRYAVEHVGICNPHWPRKSPEDKHEIINVKETHSVKHNQRPNRQGQAEDRGRL
jgi:hypothetical protein